MKDSTRVPFCPFPVSGAPAGQLNPTQRLALGWSWSPVPEPLTAALDVSAMLSSRRLQKGTAVLPGQISTAHISAGCLEEAVSGQRA